MDRRCPNCNSSIIGNKLMDSDGNSTLFESVTDFIDGELVVQFGVKCKNCDWSQFARFKPEEAIDYYYDQE